ncbi:MAG: DUF2852 domain-containing protein [Pseudomonadota bacterium]
MTNTALIRPAWTPATIALMVVGFVLWWPLGLAMLAYILFGERFPEVKRGVNEAADTVANAFGRAGAAGGTKTARTGNAAFDDWREAELSRLDEERRKLDEMRADFDEYVRELRRAKDQEDFDRFMADRKPTKKSSRKTKSVPKFNDLGSQE